MSWLSPVFTTPLCTPWPLPPHPERQARYWAVMRLFEDVLRSRAYRAWWDGHLPEPATWLDIGETNQMSAFLSQRYHITPDQTAGNLDTLILSGQYDLVTCLEVIEHLFNPLHLLGQIKNVLAPSGALLLTTPCSPFPVSCNHFHEVDRSRLYALVERAGLNITIYLQRPRRRLRSILSGVRPAARWLLGCRNTSICLIRRGENG
jgi:hypothetical protein